MAEMRVACNHAAEAMRERTCADRPLASSIATGRASSSPVTSCQSGVRNRRLRPRSQPRGRRLQAQRVRAVLSAPCAWVAPSRARCFSPIADRQALSRPRRRRTTAIEITGRSRSLPAVLFPSCFSDARCAARLVRPRAGTPAPITGATGIEWKETRGRSRRCHGGLLPCAARWRRRPLATCANGGPTGFYGAR